MVPVSRHSRLPTMISTPWARDTSQTWSVPAMAVPTMLPATPTTSANSIDATPTPTDAATLATTIRLRCGTSVNVVRPVR